VRRGIGAAAALLGFVALPAVAVAAEALVAAGTIPLAGVRGRIDHLAVDPARHRLFVAEVGNDTLDVVDLAAGKAIRRIGGLAAPQGVGYSPRADIVAIANAGDGSVQAATAAGGRTSLFVPERDRLYVAARAGAAPRTGGDPDLSAGAVTAARLALPRRFGSPIKPACVSIWRARSPQDPPARKGHGPGGAAAPSRRAGARFLRLTQCRRELTCHDASAASRPAHLRDNSKRTMGPRSSTTSAEPPSRRCATGSTGHPPRVMRRGPWARPAAA
jgi:hypothetical protein